MMKIDGTVTISLESYKWMESQIKKYETLLNMIKRTNSESDWEQKYEIDIKNMVEFMMNEKVVLITDPKIEIDKGVCYIKAEVED